ncbi:MAG TPA: hypothetical protein PLI68_03990 [Bacteroidia bacterium]|nr:hypothetical protein [Bacteroidia bacterium]
MPESIAGLGRKRPQLNIPVELLDLDPNNPRLAKESRGSTQFDLLQILYDQFDVDELAYSMSENGYFDEEPIVVVPHKLPKGFKISPNVEQQQNDLQGLIKKGSIRFVVVEGNRRLATLRLLLDDDLRKRIKVASDFPKPSSAGVVNDLKIIPAIFYSSTDDIAAYLGVRHIAGLLKWEAYAKAVFLASRIEEGIKKKRSVEDSIKEVQRQTADRSDVIRKQYLCYKVLKEAEDDLSFDTTNIKNKFSLITVALNSPNIRNFIGVKSYKEIDFSKKVVPAKKIENLNLLLTWIYGNGKDKQPILTDSRRITSRLAPVLSDDDATDYLIKYDALEEAYERSGGEKTFLIKKLNDAIKNMRNALSIAYKYKTSDIELLVGECISAGEELKKMLK